jgi:hypothetical protein
VSFKPENKEKTNAQTASGDARNTAATYTAIFSSVIISVQLLPAGEGKLKRLQHVPDVRLRQQRKRNPWWTTQVWKTKVSTYVHFQACGHIKDKGINNRHLPIAWELGIFTDTILFTRSDVGSSSPLHNHTGVKANVR